MGGIDELMGDRIKKLDEIRKSGINRYRQGFVEKIHVES